MALAAFRGVFSQSRIALFAASADVSESSALARNYGAFGVAFRAGRARAAAAPPRARVAGGGVRGGSA